MKRGIKASGHQTRPEEIVIREWPTDREPYLSKPIASFEYRPLENNPTLFFQFAATEPSRDGILAFANEYGQLADPFPEEYSVLENVKRPLVNVRSCSSGSRKSARCLTWSGSMNCGRTRIGKRFEKLLPGMGTTQR